MTTFINETIGSHDNKTHEYVTVWFDEEMVSRFSFHDIMSRDCNHNHYRLFGVSVEARHIFAAMLGFSSVEVMGIQPDGSKFGCTWTETNDVHRTVELHRGDKYGKVIARMTRTGYVQK